MNLFQTEMNCGKFTSIIEPVNEIACLTIVAKLRLTKLNRATFFRLIFLAVVYPSATSQQILILF